MQLQRGRYPYNSVEFLMESPATWWWHLSTPLAPPTAGMGLSEKYPTMITQQIKQEPLLHIRPKQLQTPITLSQFYPDNPFWHGKIKCSLTIFTEHPVCTLVLFLHHLPIWSVTTSNTHIACYTYTVSTLEVLPWIIHIPVSHNKPRIVFPYHKSRQLPNKRFNLSQKWWFK